MHSELNSIALELRRFFADSLKADDDAPGTAGQDDCEFNRFALNLFRLQCELNLPYRRLCAARRTLTETLTDWRQIPAIPASGFKEFAFSCLPPPTRTTWFESSGTTRESRSRIHHSLESLNLYHASVLPWFQHHVLPETVAAAGRCSECDFLSLTPSRSDAPHSSLVHMLDVVSAQPWWNRTAFAGVSDAQGAWRMDLTTVVTATRHAHETGRPLTLAGTAFNFVHLLDGLGTGPHRLPQGSRIMETGGYKGRSRELSRTELHEALALKFQVPRERIVTEYGMTELGSQAYDRVAGRSAPGGRFRFPPWVRVTIVSCETGREVNTGETGLVCLVDLANAFGAIAVETEDLAVRRDTGFELVGRRPPAAPRGCSLMTA
jgi:hypothetical protein